MGCSQSKAASKGIAGVLETATRETKNLLNPVVNLVKVFDPTDNMKSVNQAARRLKNIFAVPLEAIETVSYKLPVHEKSERDRELIQAAIEKNFVFDHLTKEEYGPFVNAFEKVHFPKDEKIIVQGDVGDYFYVITRGKVAFEVNGEKVGEPAGKGTSFGELALLYQAPRAATVVAASDVTLFRIDQRAFRYILRSKSSELDETKRQLLTDEKSLFKDLSPQDIRKLVQLMTPRDFKKGDKIVTKGEAGKTFFIVQRGEIQVSDIGDEKTSQYGEIAVGPGGQIGQAALLKNEPYYRLNAIAVTDGKLFRIEKEAFTAVLGDFDQKVRKAMATKQLGFVKVIKDLDLDSATLEALSSCMVEETFEAGTKIIENGQKTDAALYFVRKGSGAKLDKNNKKVAELGELSYFGEEMLLQDSGKQSPSTEVKAPYTVLVAKDMAVGILRLKDCRDLIDTTYFGKGPYTSDSIRLKKIVKLDDLTRHRILGAGTFGQVWLVSRVSSGGSRRAYALKVQSKFELVQSGQAQAVVDEKNIMKILQHPFLSTLEASFHDDSFVFILMKLIQGGELYKVMEGKMADRNACFYAYGIAEGLAFMHRRGYVYRDLKPENVLVSDKGYPVIVDYGFVKYITDKTYTLCGTPLYIAPEVIQNRGHDWGADHWSLGVLIYEMLCGETPFYREGMDQMELFHAIIKGHFRIPAHVGHDARSLIKGLLERSTSKRIGSLANDEEDILQHHWFAKLNKEKYLSMELQAPYVPKIQDPFDGSNFDNWSHLEDKLKTKYPPLLPKDSKVFVDF